MVVLSSLLLLSAMVQAQEPAAPQPERGSFVRGIYWDLGYGHGTDQSLANPAPAIAHLKALGVSQVHLWVNDQPPIASATLRCDADFGYSQDWTADDVRGFVRALKDNHFQVVLTISPWVPSRRYIDLLTAGPLQIAKDAQVPVEYDMEGNYTDKYDRVLLKTCKDALPNDNAEVYLLEQTRAVLGPGTIGMSVAVGHLTDHLTLLRSVDWIAPQAYSVDDIPKVTQILGAAGFSKPVWWAISAQSKHFNKDEGPGLSERQFDGAIRFVSAKWKADPIKTPGYVIWARREILPSFSSYGTSYLLRTATCWSAGTCLPIKDAP